MTTKKLTKLLALYLPYILLGLVATNFGEAWRLAEGKELGDKIMSMMGAVPLAFASPLPSLHPLDLLVGLCCGAGLRLAVYLRGKNAKKYRHGMEYGSARWGTPKDIEPFMAPKFSDNIILTKTERLMMSNRPPDPKNARNKNVLVVGGSGSGKTRFWLKPNLLQCHSSYVVTDPKGTIVLECGNAMLKNGYKVRILNTINFKKSMHYNPFSYVHSEKDILKLVTTLMTNTKGEGSGGDPFWEKSERLLLTALIAYLHYEAPVEEQNFATLLEMLNTMQVLEDDEEYQNPVDLLFEELAKKKPNSFAGRQYKLYKLAVGGAERAAPARPHGRGDLYGSCVAGGEAKHHAGSGGRRRPDRQRRADLPHALQPDGERCQIQPPRRLGAGRACTGAGKVHHSRFRHWLRHSGGVSAEHFPSLLPGRQIPQPRVRRRGTGTFSGVGDRRSPRRLRLGGGKLGQGHDHCGGAAGRGGKDGAGDGKPLLLSAGQGGRVHIPVLVKAKFFQQMYCTVFAFFRQFCIQQQLLRHTLRKKTALTCHCRSSCYAASNAD